MMLLRLLVFATCHLALAQGLNKRLRELSGKWKKDDPFNSQWQKELFDYTKTLGDKETFEAKDEDDVDRPIEKDVMQLSQKQYEEIFNGENPPDKPWFVAFVRKKRTSDQHWHNSYVTNTMKLLADQYDGAVQFAIVDAMKERKLESSFEVLVVPTAFFYKDGTWYEMEYMHILVNQVRSFIDGRYQEDDQVTRKFTTPWLEPSIANKLQTKKYEFTKYWRKSLRDASAKKIKQVFRSEAAKAIGLNPVDVDNFYKQYTSHQQASIALSVIFTLAVVVLIVSCCCLRCLVRRWSKAALDQAVTKVEEGKRNDKEKTE